MKFITTSGVSGSTTLRRAEQYACKKDWHTAAQTLLTISKSQFSKAKQTGIVTLIQLQWGGLNDTDQMVSERQESKKTPLVAMRNQPHPKDIKKELEKGRFRFEDGNTKTKERARIKLHRHGLQCRGQRASLKKTIVQNPLEAFYWLHG